MHTTRVPEKKRLSNHECGNYRLTGILGKGGFAKTFLGKHKYLGTEAAIKISNADLTQSDIERFYQEARVAARLQHPHIVRVLDFGVEHGMPFLVMDYAPHGTLRQRHPYGELVPLEIVLDYAEQCANALQYIHDQGLIHRDVKPENLLLGQDNRLLVSDFGITIAADADSVGHEENIGTLLYMAPEHLNGEPCFASDQYALALIVCEWLCGEPPFVGSAAEIFEKRVYEPPVLPAHSAARIPHAIQQVLLKALATEPEQRFASIREFAQALRIAYRKTNTMHSLPTYHRASLPQRERKQASQLIVRRQDVTSQPPPRKRKRRRNIWKDIATLFAADMLIGSVVFAVLYLLGTPVQTLEFFVLLCLTALPLLGAWYMKSKAILCYTVIIFLLSATFGIGFHSPTLFIVLYIGLLLLSSLLALSLLVRQEKM